MSKDSFQTSPEAVADQAINQVLEAERNAQRAVEDCEQRAGELLREAQVRARRIQQRCDERIKFIHMRCAQRLAEYARAPAGADSDTPSTPPTAAGDSTAIGRAIDALAAGLSGAEEGDV